MALSQVADKVEKKISSKAGVASAATPEAAAAVKPVKLPKLPDEKTQITKGETPTNQNESVTSSLGNMMLGKVAILSALLVPSLNNKLIFTEAMKKIVKTEENAVQKDETLHKRSSNAVLNSIQILNNQLSLLVLPRVAPKAIPVLQDRRPV